VNNQRSDANRQAAMVRRLLGAMGLGSTTALLVACGGKAIIDGASAEGGGGTSGVSNGGNTSGPVTTSGPEPFECNVELPPHTELVYGCIPTTTCPSKQEVLDYFTTQYSGVCTDPGSCWCYGQDPDFCSCYKSVYDVPCGPDPNQVGSCCYYAEVNVDLICEGRPFMVAGKARRAAAADRDDWLATATPGVETLDPDLRLQLAQAWRDDALAEHASIASFARFVLELLAVGAPPDLVRRAQKAMADEVRHAELCFGLASAYGGGPMGPGLLAIEDSVARADLATIAAATARDGCINETLAALVAAAARDAASDEAVCAALDEIVDDETDHAALAWGFVAWACSQDPAARRAVLEVFGEAGAETVPQPQLKNAEHAATMRAHGQLPEDERRRVAAKGLREVVMPCAQALFRNTRREEARA
jgi:hypothetical protein